MLLPLTRPDPSSPGRPGSPSKRLRGMPRCSKPARIAALLAMLGLIAATVLLADLLPSESDGAGATELSRHTAAEFKARRPIVHAVPRAPAEVTIDIPLHTPNLPSEVPPTPDSYPSPDTAVPLPPPELVSVPEALVPRPSPPSPSPSPLAVISSATVEGNQTGAWRRGLSPEAQAAGPATSCDGGATSLRLIQLNDGYYLRTIHITTDFQSNYFICMCFTHMLHEQVLRLW